MKKVILAISLSLLYFNIVGQNYSSLVVRVVDATKQVPLEGVLVTIEQSGFQSQLSEKDGKILFERYYQ